MPEQHDRRKGEHLELCIDGPVGFREKTTLFEQVELVHDSLPELSVDEIDLSTEILGKKLRAPLVIAAMTGGVDRAEAINRDLASVAEELGIGFALGSQRPMLDGDTTGYLVRDVAPTALVLGNIGAVQARDSTTARIADIVRLASVDALCVHLNPAQEMVQPGGDTDFRGCLDAIARVTSELDVPVVVKETGCGLSRRVGERLVAAGVAWVDVSGAGGTSWVAVETERTRGASQAVGKTFREWGIPTAASVAQLSGLELQIIATGGVRDGLTIARALALGAHAGGVARPFLIAHASGGRDAVKELAEQWVTEIRLACLLAGARTPAALQSMDIVIGEQLRGWIPRATPLAQRVGIG